MGDNRASYLYIDFKKPAVREVENMEVVYLMLFFTEVFFKILLINSNLKYKID